MVDGDCGGVGFVSIFILRDWELLGAAGYSVGSFGVIAAGPSVAIDMFSRTFERV